MLKKDLVIDILRSRGLIGNHSVDFKPLKGGVSSDIYLVSEGKVSEGKGLKENGSEEKKSEEKVSEGKGADRTMVIKQALPKLQVADDWYADVARNKTEQAFIRFMENIRPAAVPELLYSDQEHSFFVMEYLDSTFENWKKQMLNGKFRAKTAREAAELLADIHLQSRDDGELLKAFDTTPGFESLRVEPYLITTGKRHPELQDLFFNEAERILQHREALVHGDFSPKNIMVGPKRLVILDHEVAWYGDPAFDIAFLLNHLYLKMLVHYRASKDIRDLTGIAWEAYFTKMGPDRLQEMEPRIGRLLLMLMLARVDGKSPVEYLYTEAKAFIRNFVYNLLPAKQYGQTNINTNWKAALKSGQI